MKQKRKSFEIKLCQARNLAQTFYREVPSAMSKVVTLSINVITWTKQMRDS